MKNPQEFGGILDRFSVAEFVPDQLFVYVGMLRRNRAIRVLAKLSGPWNACELRWERDRKDALAVLTELVATVVGVVVAKPRVQLISDGHELKFRNRAGVP